jgi:hypothetical protein
LIRPGAIATVMKVLEANSDLGALFVNHTEEQHAERERGDHLAAKEVYQSARLLCHDTSERRVDRWEDIVLLSNVPGIFTAISDHIFLKEIWVRRAPTLALANYEPDMVLSYELVFPHVSMLDDELVGKPAYYLGFPYVMLFVGHQEWGGLWAKYLLTFIIRIPDQLELRGSSAEVARHYRNMIFKNCVYAFRTLLSDRVRASAKGAEWTRWRFRPEDDWSFWRLLLRFYGYQEFRRMVNRALLEEIFSFGVRILPFGDRLQNLVDARRARRHAKKKLR